MFKSQMIFCCYVVLIGLLPFTAHANSFSAEKRQQLALLIAQHHYKQPALKQIKPSVIDAKSLADYLRSLDNYSRYLSPQENQFFKQRAKLQRIGLGMNLLVGNEEILAIPLANSPAFQGGFKMPAYLLSLNDVFISFADFSSYRFLTRLKLNEKVKIKLNTASGEKQLYFIKADNFQRPVVEYAESAQHAVITIYEFRDVTTKLLRQYLRKAARKPFLVIDLRYCPGGDLYATVDALSLLLPTGLDVVHLRKKGSNKSISLQTLPEQVNKKQPNLSLLSSRYTASSAEVFIAALQEYWQGVQVIGEASVGKCVAQAKYVLDDGSALLLSEYELLTPRSQACNGVPIVPDRVVKEAALQAAQALY